MCLTALEVCAASSSLSACDLFTIVVNKGREN